MAEQRTCPQCGSPLDAAAAGVSGPCPNCQTLLSPSDAPVPAVPHDPLLGETLGDFEILEQLGRGGMGVVYKAREGSLDRLVALKVLPAGLVADSHFVVRFEREARAAAAIRHRNIVQIHAVGQARGHRYIAMEYIDGESLADVLRREGALPQERALAVMRPVLSAMAAAHEAGIVHRDIKPANIMFDARGDVRVTDFGLAKRTEGDVAVTDVGQSLGTPLYMAPEAATGDEATAKSDLYSLGGTFYAVLSGRPPFEGRTAGELILKHATEAASPLAELAPNADPRLCEIIDRLLRKDPDKRYPSAQAVLAEIDALGELTSAGDALRAEGRALIGDAPTLVMTEGQRLGLEAAQRRDAPPAGRKRRVGHIATVSILGAVAAVWLIVALTGKGPQPDPKVSDPPVLFEKDIEVDATLERDAKKAFQHARNAASMRRWDVVVEAVDRLESEYGKTEFYGANRADIGKLRAEAAAKLAALPPDDPLPDDLPDEAPAPLAEGWVSLFDGKTLDGWRIFKEGDFARPGPINVTDGKMLLGRGAGGTALMWTREFPTVDYEISLEAMRLGGAQVFAGFVFPIKDSHCLFELGRQIAALATVDGRGADDNGTAKRMAFQNGQWYRTRLRVTAAKVEAWIDEEKVIDLPTAGRRFGTWGNAQGIRPLGVYTWAASGALRNIRLRRLKGVAPKAAAGPECRLLATLRGHTRGVVAIAFSPDGARIATGSQDNTVKLWDGANWQPLRTLAGHEGWVESVAFSPDGKQLITSSMDRTVRIWDAATGACLTTLEGHTDAAHAAFFLPDGQRAVSAGTDGAVRIWDTTTGKRLKSFTDPGGRTDVQHMILSADGKRLATCGMDDMVRLWDVDTGVCLRKVHAASQKLWCVALSPDGKRVASVGNDPAVKIWNADTGQLLKRLGSPRLNRGLAFSPDGKWLAAGDWNGSLQFWDAKTYDHVKAVRGHSKTTFKIAFSPDGKRLASVSFDGTAKIWALEAPDAAAKLPGKPGEWVPLFDGETLDGWRVAKGGFFKNPGAVAVVGDRVLLEAGRPGTGIAVARSVPVEDYEFCVDAMRIDGRAGFCSILFPVGTSRCTLAVGGFGGGGVGLQTVDGRGGNNNPTTRQMQFQPGQWYQVRLRVTKDKIEAWVDDERMFSIERAGHKFGVFDGYESLRPLGVFSWTTTSALRNMRMRSLKPEAGPPAAPELPHRLKE